ncbi:hypothetical protein Micbo1qcDRAFT_176083 [Microdochium bolleyi]|uniref:Uncharacterized protein n=1 Tax=Microdochium bolleyi TaxID=196109 RepID=A0A136J1T3_9PEZI|nr:hypothetical protein Micbo1qcDRAFT_176083 [Microdochium bolleyi]
MITGEIMSQALNEATAQAAQTADKDDQTLPETRPKLATEDQSCDFSTLATCSSHVSSAHPLALSSPDLLVANGQPKTRSRKKALDGRPEIRNLPGFDDDPIEET